MRCRKFKLIVILTILVVLLTLIFINKHCKFKDIMLSDGKNITVREITIQDTFSNIISITDEGKINELFSYIKDLNIKPLYIKQHDSGDNMYYITIYIDNHNMIGLRCSDDKYIEVYQNINEDSMMKKYKLLDKEFIRHIKDIIKE